MIVQQDIIHIFEANGKIFSYSAKLNYHILPMIRKHKNSKIDLYVTSKIGGYHFKKNKFEYNAGLGLAYYPKNHFGFYTEYTYGNFMINSFSARGGISYKFYK